jgi:hypothetical protein
MTTESTQTPSREKRETLINIGWACIVAFGIVSLAGGYIQAAPETVFDVSTDMHAPDHAQASLWGLGLICGGLAGVATGAAIVWDNKDWLSATEPRRATLDSNLEAAALG